MPRRLALALPCLLLLALAAPAAAADAEAPCTRAEAERFLAHWPALARWQQRHAEDPDLERARAAWMARRGWEGDRLFVVARRLSAAVMELEAAELAAELAVHRVRPPSSAGGGVTGGEDLSAGQRRMLLGLDGTRPGRARLPESCREAATPAELALVRRLHDPVWTALEAAAARGLTP